MTGPERLQIPGHGFVDDIELFLHATERGRIMCIVREYERVIERWDLKRVAPWARFRQALQGVE